MNDKRDNIYIYLWEEFNTIYVGRTVNPKGRHWAHKHRNTEATYKFSSEHHVEHPKMVIIENDLTIEEGIEREKYWINEYRKNSSYNVLNKLKGGGVGRKSIYTEEESKVRRVKYIEQYNDSHKKEHKNYREGNKEKIKAYKKLYREANKDKVKEQLKNWRESHKEEIKAYRDAHKDEIKIKRKLYRETHKAEIKAYRDAHKAEMKAWRENHKEELKEYYKKRYILKKERE